MPDHLRLMMAVIQGLASASGVEVAVARHFFSPHVLFLKYVSRTGSNKRKYVVSLTLSALALMLLFSAWRGRGRRWMAMTSQQVATSFPSPPSHLTFHYLYLALTATAGRRNSAGEPPIHGDVLHDCFAGFDAVIACLSSGVVIRLFTEYVISYVRWESRIKVTV